MNLTDYDKVVFAQTVWRLAKSDTVQELLAIACTIRNHIIPRVGSVATYDSYLEACQDFLKFCPVRDLPTIEDSFVSPNGILVNIDDIYSCSYPDITSTHDHPAGARFFGRAASIEPGSWFDLEIIKKPAIHTLLGTWGSQQFFE